MGAHIPTARGHVIAYTTSALATLLWASSVMPAGTTGAPVLEDLVTPLHREAWLLVPALLLLIVGPVGVVLSRTRVGLAAVLAATDAFVAIYMATTLTAWGAFQGPVSGCLVGLLYGIGLLSLFEMARLLRLGSDIEVTPYLRGLRLALCLLALLTPSWVLVQQVKELASLLAPYALIAIGAGGAAMARTESGLRLTAAILHLAFAAHVFIVLRYTIFEADDALHPRIVEVTAFGWFTLGTSILILALALLQVLRLARRARRESARAAVAHQAAAS